MNLHVVLLMFYTPIFAGFLFRKDGIPRSGDISPLVDYVVYLALPCLIIESFGTRSLVAVYETAVLMMTFSFITQISSFFLISVLTSLFARDMDDRSRAVVILTASFQNTAFLPLPIALSLWGDRGVVAVVFYMLINGFLMNTMGAFIAASYSGESTRMADIIRSALSYPPMAASIIGIVILVSPWTIGAVASTILSFIGDTTVPVILFTIGYRLAGSVGNANKFARACLLTAFIRFVFSPFLNLYILDFVTTGDLERSVIMLEAGMPPAVMNSALAEKYKLNVNLASQIIPILTAVSLFLIPVWLLMT